MSQALAKELIAEGTVIAHYRVIEPIGAGGMGEVRRKRDSGIAREFAIRLLPASFGIIVTRTEYQLHTEGES